jgi:hypothetical protein
MYDSIEVSQIPAGAPAVAGYTSGNWPTFASLARLFPHARRLSIAVNAGQDADVLDVEAGDATIAQAAAWVRRKKSRGAARPALYAAASNMGALLHAVEAAGITRASVRLWSAHYGAGAHICGPGSCRYPGVPACDGTQWTQNALGRNLDESLLADDFFATSPAPKPAPRRKPMLGQITAAKTDIVLPDGASNIRFGCSVAAKITVDLRSAGTPNPDLALDYSSCQAVTTGSNMVVVHVTQAPADGTPIAYAVW